MSTRIVIAGACRTPMGKLGGRLKDIHPRELLRVCFAETLTRANVSVGQIHEAVAGTCIHLPDSANIARVALLCAGLTEEEIKHHRDSGHISAEIAGASATKKIPAVTLSRNCGSGAEAIVWAVDRISSPFNDTEIVLAGGTESMSHAPYVMKRRELSRNYRMGHATLADSLIQGLSDPLTGESMGMTAEHIAKKYGISREDQDVFASGSHKKAHAAVRGGSFISQIVSVAAREENILFDRVDEKKIHEDEGPNATRTTPSKLGTLKPYFDRRSGNGTITVGNCCPVNDGASSILVLTLEKAEELSIEPQAEIIGYGVAALDPSYMGEGPSCVIPPMLKRAGLSINDVDLFEINEAFAATTLAVQRSLAIPDEKLNVHGGAIALGHPVGATGAILTTKAIYALHEFEKEYAVISLCVGGGQGVGLLVKRFKGGE